MTSEQLQVIEIFRDLIKRYYPDVYASIYASEQQPMDETED